MAKFAEYLLYARHLAEHWLCTLSLIPSILTKKISWDLNPGLFISTAILITTRPFCPRYGASSLDSHWCVLWRGRLLSQKVVGGGW